MSQPEEWLEELLGFSEDGTRRVFMHCQPPVAPEGLESPDKQVSVYTYVVNWVY